MESNKFELIRNDRRIHIAVGIVGTLFLGALGSGLWELVLRDVFIWAGNITLTFISSIWGGYVEQLHRNIGKLHQDLLTIPLFAIAIALIIFGPWVMIWRLFGRTARLKNHIAISDLKKTITPEQRTEQINAIQKAIWRRLVPMIAISTVFYAILTWQTIYKRDAANWAERSTEILLPYVTAQEYMKLRSDLRAIEDAEHFYKLEKQLQDFAAKASIKLPVFTVIRKRRGNPL